MMVTFIRLVLIGLVTVATLLTSGCIIVSD
jgi:hypothetical protein